MQKKEVTMTKAATRDLGEHAATFCTSAKNVDAVSTITYQWGESEHEEERINNYLYAVKQSMG